MREVRAMLSACIVCNKLTKRQRKRELEIVGSIRGKERQVRGD
jgi:hypothetical protein